MFYTVYKITNNVNGMIYIGSHQTKNINDDYFGSGRYIKCAIEKYGLENFVKEILFIFENEQEMFKKERELVNEEFINDPKTYNIVLGGQGGFNFINNNSLNYKFTNEDAIKGVKARNESDNWRQSLKRRKYDDTKYDCLRGENSPTKRPEVRAKISVKRKGVSTGNGSANSQFGTCWITNGKENSKIRTNDEIPFGWYKGRTIKK